MAGTIDDPAMPEWARPVGSAPRQSTGTVAKTGTGEREQPGPLPGDAELGSAKTLPRGSQSGRSAARRRRPGEGDADYREADDTQIGSPRPGRDSRAGREAPTGEDDPAKAYDSCLRLLGARARSRGELVDRLTQRGFSEDVVAEVTGRLEREQLIDDADFADQWVHFRHRDGGKAKRALAQELRHKGVADDVAAIALEQISAGDEAERAAELVRRKLSRKAVDPNLETAQREKEMRRLVGMLARKGYSAGLAYRVVKEAWAARAESAD
ncbi:regulatory protein RecX [Tomitella biformata]|uniref:regulatory protein RecX n=2 Tax=Tomitella biformata TaxID=630403 RepID=UPI00046369C5|nr:regulatory protein RecX [Tomitella biformata]